MVKRIIRKVFTPPILAITLVGIVGVGIALAFSGGNGKKVDVNDTLSIGGVEVELHSLDRSLEGITIEYSYQPEETVFQLGVSSITKSDGSKLEATSGAGLSNGNISETIPYVPVGRDQSGAVYLGSFVKYDTTKTGTKSFDLGSDYSSMVNDSESENSTLPINTNFSVDNAQYKVSELTFDRESTTRNFILVLTPVNDVAKQTEIAAGPSTASLSDNLGNSYHWLGTRTRWTRNANGQHEVAWQQLSFKGTPSADAQRFTLSINGSGTVSGPFVFDDITLP